MAALIGIVGSVVSAYGTIMSGMAAQQAAEYQARQLEVKATEERAASQREAEEINKEKEFAISRVQTVSAASGFTATDPTILKLSSDIEAAGTYRKGMVRYGGESRALGLIAQAKGARMSGQAALTGSYFGAAGTILGGATSLFGKYGGGGPTGGYSYYYG